MFLSTVTSTVPGGRIDLLYNVLASQTTHVVCVDFIREWRDLQFNGKFLFTFRVFDRKSPKKYSFFSYFVLMSNLGYE